MTTLTDAERQSLGWAMRDDKNNSGLTGRPIHLSLTLRAVESIVAARVAEALAPVVALAERWERDAVVGAVGGGGQRVWCTSHADALRAAVEQGKAGQA